MNEGLFESANQIIEALFPERANQIIVAFLPKEANQTIEALNT